MKKGKYKIGDTIVVEKLTDRELSWKAFIPEINETYTIIGTSYEEGEYVLHLTKSKWIFAQDVRHAHGYQTPLWKVLNGEEIE